MAEREMLTTKELADRWGMHPKTIHAWRGENRGPVFARVGRRILYRLADVQEYEASHSSAAPPAASLADVLG